MNPKPPSLPLAICVCLSIAVWCLTQIPLHAADNWRTANRDKLTAFPTQQLAIEAAQRTAAQHTGDTYALNTGRSMGPTSPNYSVYRDNFKGIVQGDRVRFIGKDGKDITHRVIVVADGYLIVSGETWPQRIDYVTPQNYRGTVVEICTWATE